MQNQLLYIAKKYATTTPEIIFLLVPYISSFTLQEGWHIYIEWVNLIWFYTALYHDFNRLPARKWGLDKKDMESTLDNFDL